MSEPVRFTVHGTPQPRGSKSAFAFRKAGGNKLGVRMADDNPKSKTWMAAVSQSAGEAMGDRPLLCGPLQLEVTLVMARPQSHFGTGKNAGVLKASAPTYKSTKPDCSKMLRAIEDAMSKVVYNDDAQLACVTVSKVYGNADKALITVMEIQP